MAENGFLSFIPKEYRDELILVGALVLYKWFTGKEREPEKGKEFHDIRGELLGDMLPRDKYPNLWRRHEKSKASKTENRFVTLLAKVPQPLRAQVFPSLEAVTDPEFEQALELLHHDQVKEFMERIVLHASPAFVSAWAFVRDAHEKTVNPWLEGKISERSGRPLRVGRPILRALAWGIGIPMGLAIIALAMVFMFA